MEKRDVKVCAPMFVKVFTSPPWEYHWVTEDKARRYIEDILITPGSLCFLYYEESKLLGFCLGAVSDYFLEAQYEIKEFGILPQSQRQGSGSRMLGRIEEYLAESKIYSIFLHTSKNAPAYGFYVKNNYMLVENSVYLAKSVQ